MADPSVLAQLLAVVAVRTAPAVVTATSVDPDLVSVREIGLALVTRHAFSLQIIGVLLLGATIGAVLLAKKRFV